jgi:hypothetical protein
MRSDFEALNLILYYRVINGLLDLVIWCLGPYVHRTREYGFLRRRLGAVTRWCCGLWISSGSRSRRSA